MLRLEWQRDWSAMGLSFLFFFPSFSLIALLCLISFVGFCFSFSFFFFSFLFFYFFFRVTWAQGSRLGQPAGIRGPKSFC